MSRVTYTRLVDFLRDRVGDGVKLIIRYTETESDVLYGETWFERYLDAEDTRSPEKMHSDAVGRLQQATLASELYASEVTAEIRVTDRGTGLYLFPTGREGVFVWFGPDADVTVPAITDECLARLDAGT